VNLPGSDKMLGLARETTNGDHQTEVGTMKTKSDRRLAFLLPFLILVPTAGPRAQTPPVASAAAETRVEREAFLSNAAVLDHGGLSSDATPSRRVTLDDGKQRHDAAVETADGTGPTTRNYRFNVAAYELNKAIGLNLVPPTVERVVSGRPASVSWWADGFALSELDRRRKGIDPPDPEGFSRQVQAVRVFDELISNTYRDISPPLYLNSVWDNLLITTDWIIWITDHTGAFRIRARLENPESLNRCDRALLGGLRGLNRALLQRTLGKYLSPQQVGTLEVRRTLLLKHFDELIAKQGQTVVLYDLPPRR
jgi:hypothetical protein